MNVQQFALKWCPGADKDEFNMDLLKVVKGLSNNEDSMHAKLDEILAIINPKNPEIIRAVNPCEKVEDNCESVVGPVSKYTSKKTRQSHIDAIEKHPLLENVKIVGTCSGGKKIGITDIKNAISSTKNKCSWICDDTNPCNKDGDMYAENAKEYYCSNHMKVYSDKTDRHLEEMVEANNFQDVIVGSGDEDFDEIVSGSDSEVDSDSDVEQTQIVDPEPEIVEPEIVEPEIETPEIETPEIETPEPEIETPEPEIVEPEIETPEPEIVEPIDTSEIETDAEDSDAEDSDYEPEGSDSEDDNIFDDMFEPSDNEDEDLV